MNQITSKEKGAVTTFTASKGFKLFITSDVHFDSPFCNRKQFFADMDYAISEGCKVVIVGDFFDAMQGKFDKRRDWERIRPEHRRNDYYDAIVRDAAKKLEPYAKHILMITPGNHELSVLSNANTDITGNLVERLSQISPVLTGGYGGIILLKSKGRTIPVKYFHGSGGEAPVSRGAIQTNRQAVFLPDFEVVLNGHSHHMYFIPITRERVSNLGHHYFDIQYHVRTPGYLMSYADGSSGWEVTRGGVPKPTGAFIMETQGQDILFRPVIHAPKPISAVAELYNGIIFPQE